MMLSIAFNVHLLDLVCWFYENVVYCRKIKFFLLLLYHKKKAVAEKYSEQNFITPYFKKDDTEYLSSFIKLHPETWALSWIASTVGCSVPDEDAANVQIMCAWCQKVGVKRYSLSMGSELKSFCSEKCFAACRRAYFKRNKVEFICPQLGT